MQRQEHQSSDLLQRHLHEEVEVSLLVVGVPGITGRGGGSAAGGRQAQHFIQMLGRRHRQGDQVAYGLVETCGESITWMEYEDVIRDWFTVRK